MARRVSYSTSEGGPCVGSDAATQLQSLPNRATIADTASSDVVPAVKQAWVDGGDASPRWPEEETSTGEASHRLHSEQEGPARKQTTLALHFGRSERYLTVDDLKQIRKRYEKPGAKLTLNGFVHLVETFLAKRGITPKPEEIAAFFQRIDYDSSGTIDWHKISSYMYLDFKQRNAISSRAKGVVFQVPAVVANSSPHREALCRIYHLSDGCLVTCSSVSPALVSYTITSILNVIHEFGWQNGVVCIWTKEMKPKRIRKAATGFSGKPKWVTDMTVSAGYGKVILTTGDCEIQFYELVNFQPYCQLKRLETVPLKIALWENPNNEGECLLLIGDQSGALTVLIIADVREAFKYWKLGEKFEGLPTYPFEKLLSNTECTTRVFRWKLHKNWISEVHYLPTLRCFASCSCDEVSSMVVGTPTGSTSLENLMPKHRSAVTYISRSFVPAKRRLRGDQRVFKVHSGVFSVDYCTRNNVLVTGSPDRYIRIWNPYITSKPVAVLSGHTTPIFRVRVESNTNKIYSVGSDNTIKVWDIVDHTCLSSLTPGQHRLFSPAQAFHLNPITKQLLLSTEFEHLAAVQVEHEEELMRDSAAATHKAPITAVTYSRCFNKIISACEGAFVKVWELDSGVCAFEYLVGDGVSGITAIDIDHSGRRLVTATQNGAINMWNFNNGQCIKTLIKDNTEEITDVKFVTVKKNRYIIAVGWDHKVTIFADDSGSDAMFTQKPLETWSDSQHCGHKDDIMSVAFGSPDLMATAGCNGEIILWRLILCNVICKLKPPVKVSADKEVQKVLFLEQRVGQRCAATLVAGGPSGYIHFWNIYERCTPMSCFLASENSVISTITVDSTNTRLLSADLQGYVTVWNIQNYCVASATDKPPHKIIQWKAHTKKITSLAVIDRGRESVIVTGSVDGWLRLWTTNGHYINAFGHKRVWELGTPSTYQHPQLPAGIHKKRTSNDGVGVRVGEETEKDDHEERSSETGEYVEEMCLQSDIDAENSVKEKPRDELLQKLAVPSEKEQEVTKVGMRLRHLRARSALKPRPGAYASLACQPLDSDITFRPPPSVMGLSKKSFHQL